MSKKKESLVGWIYDIKEAQAKVQYHVLSTEPNLITWKGRKKDIKVRVTIEEIDG